MTDWLANQQGVLCLAIVLLITLEHFFTRKLGAGLMYRLWLLVPAVLTVNNLPSQLIAVPANSFSRYVVGLNPTVELAGSGSWLLAWGAGVALLSALFAVQYCKLLFSMRKGESDAVYYSSVATTPMLFGFIKPAILLPENFCTLFSQPQQDLVIEHEQTHRLHLDHLWNTLALVIAILFWFNPLVWLGLRSFRISQEMACDEQVLRTKSAEQKLLYAKALVTCVEHTSIQNTLYPAFGGKSTMLKRLNSIKQPATVSKTLALAAILAATAFTANTALANLPQQPVSAAKINEAAPVMRVDPVYPVTAAKNNQQGSVVLQFDITETGATDNIKVVESTPAGVFDASATEALKQWQYKPRIQGGVAQRQTALLVQLDFKLGADAAAE